MTRRVLLIAILLGGAVGPASGGDEWGRVRVTSAHNESANCSPRGSLHAEIDTFWGGGTEKLYKQLRKKAAAVDADLVVLVGSVTSVELQNGTRLMADGEAYNCSSTDERSTMEEHPLFDELVKLEQHAADAALRGDREALASLLATDVVLSVDGRTIDRTEYLAAVRPMKRVERIELEDLDLELHSAYSATISGTHVLIVRTGRKKEAVKLRFRDRFDLRGGNWLLVDSRTTTQP